MTNPLPTRNQGPEEGGFLWQDELLFGQCDAKLNVRMSTLVEHLVTSASQHCRSFGMTYHKFLESDRAFVLIRCNITVHKLPACFQLLTLVTWIDGLKGPYYQRITQWRDTQGNVVVSSRSDWVLIQPSNREFCKPDKDDARFTVKSPVNLPQCRRIKFGDLSLASLGQHKITWSQIDGNGHLHCANFVDIAWDFLPPHLQTQSPSQFEIEFQKEACLGDLMDISGIEDRENHYYMEGTSQDNSSFKASFYFAPPNE